MKTLPISKSRPKRMKMSRVELMAKVNEIIRASTSDPADDLIAMGEALAAIGMALRGQSNADARAILSAVQQIA